MLTFRLFGPGEAHYDGRVLKGFPNHQAFLLLCYLLLNTENAIHRERLAAVFWAEYPTPTSRKYLRNAIWRLRRQLEEVGLPADQLLLVDDESVMVCGDDSLWLDVRQFESTLERFHDIDGADLAPAQALQIEEALTLYTGDLLDGVYEDWCLVDRERLSLLHANGLGKLLSYYGHRGNIERALSYGQRLLARDQAREKVHRQVMWLYWLRGDRSAALAQYKRCRQILHESMGVGPMEATRSLYRKIVSNAAPDELEFENASQVYTPIVEADMRDADALAGAARRIQRLQSLILQINDELQYLEQMVNQRLLNTRR